MAEFVKHQRGRVLRTWIKFNLSAITATGLPAVPFVGAIAVRRDLQSAQVASRSQKTTAPARGAGEGRVGTLSCA